MTRADELLELAGRVEKAEKATVDLYREIYVAVHGPKPERVLGGSNELTKYLYCYNPFYSRISHGGWLDAAMMLVPEGHWAEGSLGTHVDTRASIEIHAPCTYDPVGRSTAATPENAVVAAALRALAAIETGAAA